MRKTLIFFSCIFCWNLVFAQLPNTNIYLYQMEQQGDSTFAFYNPQFLTNFNADGYNNQPAFISSNEIYFSMGSSSETSQTDIISLNLKTKIKTQVTLSEDREYSPTPLLEPYYFSCVRQEADGKNTQRLWFFPLDRSSAGKPILPLQTNVGYHCWLMDGLVALFIVGDPHQLAIANTLDRSVLTLTSNIGRCLQRLPNGNLAYIQKSSDAKWTIKELDVKTMKSTTIVTTIAESEDFVVLPNNTFLMAKGSKLYKYKKGWDTNWLEIANFEKHNLNNITRMAINSSGKIALVNVE